MFMQFIRIQARTGANFTLCLGPPASVGRRAGYQSCICIASSIWSYTISNDAELRGSSTERIPFGTYVRPNFFLVFAEFVFCWDVDADNTRRTGYGDFASSWCLKLNLLYILLWFQRNGRRIRYLWWESPSHPFWFPEYIAAVSPIEGMHVFRRVQCR
jgi:hypothetical protein